MCSVANTILEAVASKTSVIEYCLAPDVHGGSVLVGMHK